MSHVTDEKTAGRKIIAVIGAGPCGLTSAKCCLEEGLDVVVFERTEDVGGVWCYREDVTPGVPSVMKSTVLNSSKEISAFSDFPPPEHFPSYMHHSMLLRYLKSYAEKFDVMRHVKFRTEVMKVTKAPNYSETGQWLVQTKDLESEVTSTSTFDGVLIASGHHSTPSMPDYEGLSTFAGAVLHSHDVKTAVDFEDKVVVVVGIGNSAVDAAVEISSLAKQVYLSTRRGAWLYQRVGPDGKPFDVAYVTRGLDALKRVAPYGLACWWMERQLNSRVDHDVYGLRPRHRVFSQHPTVSDALPNKLLCGTVVLREDVRRFHEHGVTFMSDDKPTPVDAVVFATGYQILFPMLDSDVVPATGNRVNLYKYMFPPQLTHPSLAVVGMVQVVGAINPVAEAQIRWFARLMKNGEKLPPESAMLRDIQKTLNVVHAQYVDSPRHTIQADYITYLDDIAELIGSKPNLVKIFFTDPKLYWALLMGPSLPYQYRLRGPHSWAPAREVILNFNKRLRASLSTRKAESLK